MGGYSRDGDIEHCVGNALPDVFVLPLAPLKLPSHLVVVNESPF